LGSLFTVHVLQVDDSKAPKKKNKRKHRAGSTKKKNRNLKEKSRKCKCPLNLDSRGSMVPHAACSCVLARAFHALRNEAGGPGTTLADYVAQIMKTKIKPPKKSQAMLALAEIYEPIK
jgi:hypothetical protein